jgi:transposase
MPRSARPEKKLATAVKAAGTSLTGIFGVGPVIAATVIGDVADVARFATRDRFAAYNGTAPIEVSSGNRKTYRLSLRGNRRVNHALHMAAITQIRHPHSDGRACYERKVAEGKTHKGGAALPQTEDQRQAREGNRETALTPARLARTPHASSSEKPLPGPPPRHHDPAPRPGYPPHPGQPQRKSARPLDSALKEVSL